MAQHISQGKVISVVLPSCGLWTLGRGAGGWELGWKKETRDSPGGVVWGRCCFSASWAGWRLPPLRKDIPIFRPQASARGLSLLGGKSKLSFIVSLSQEMIFHFVLSELHLLSPVRPSRTSGSV